jgi:uncharacterized protein (TIGR00369 family)
MPDPPAPARTRTITWQDPTSALARLASLSGLEAIQAGLRGELPPPPMAELLGLRGGEVEEGRAVVVVQPAEYHANYVGAVHGALTAGLLDMAMSMAVLSTMPAGAYAPTAQMNVHFLRPLPMGSDVRAEARVLHRGQKTVAAEARIVCSEGKLCAHATTTCLVVSS